MAGDYHLNSIADLMNLEPAEDSGVTQPSTRQKEPLCVTQAALPNGKHIRLVKTLLTSACERNCYYCPFRAGRNFRRVTYKPEEMASTFSAMHRAGLAEGIFLSSGIIQGGIRSQDKLIETAELLRGKYQYQGYLHLKLMPGVDYDQVFRTMQLADRVSINLESPDSHHLEKLAPGKNFLDELMRPLRVVEQIRRSQPGYLGWNRHWPSSTTQFVVGAAGENDLDLLSTSEKLFDQFGLARTYYSAFHPQPDTPLESLPPESPLRQQRLYQASFLLREYNFAMEELLFDPDGFLPLDVDPKEAWARSNLSDSPIEINSAAPSELIRVPGLGPKGVKSILTARKIGKLQTIEDLRKIGIRPNRAAAYILLNGARPPRQMSLF